MRGGVLTGPEWLRSIRNQCAARNFVDMRDGRRRNKSRCVSRGDHLFRSTTVLDLTLSQVSDSVKGGVCGGTPRPAGGMDLGIVHSPSRSSPFAMASTKTSQSQRAVRNDSYACRVTNNWWSFSAEAMCYLSKRCDGPRYRPDGSVRTHAHDTRAPRGGRVVCLHGRGGVGPRPRFGGSAQASG